MNNIVQTSFFIAHLNYFLVHLNYWSFELLTIYKIPIKKIYSAFLLSSSRGGLLLSTENGESSSFPPLVESTKNGIPEEFLLRRAPQLLLMWRTPFFHQKRMVLLISSSCGESSLFPPFDENSPKEELRQNSFSWKTETGPAGIGWAASLKKFIDKTTHVITHELFMLSILQNAETHN